MYINMERKPTGRQKRENEQILKYTQKKHQLSVRAESEKACVLADALSDLRVSSSISE